MLLVKLIEPPCTERYARWCERSGNLVKFPSYSIYLIVIVLVAFNLPTLTVTFTLPFLRAFNTTFVADFFFSYASFILLTHHFAFPFTFFYFTFNVIVLPFFTDFLPVIEIDTFFFEVFDDFGVAVFCEEPELFFGVSSFFTSSSFTLMTTE